MIRVYRAPELPPEVPGACFVEDGHTVVLVNPACITLTHDSSEWMREVLNSLLNAPSHSEARLSEVV